NAQLCIQASLGKRPGIASCYTGFIDSRAFRSFLLAFSFLKKLSLKRGKKPGGCGLLVLVLSSPVEDKPLEFMSFLVMTDGCEIVIGFVLELALTVLGTFFASLETLSGLILNMPGAITLSLFTPLETCAVETELEVTGFDKAFISPILGRTSTFGCFANLVFLLVS
nr:hypothetical protein [Tanacetum cinerariifolium]